MFEQKIGFPLGLPSIFRKVLSNSFFSEFCSNGVCKCFVALERLLQLESQRSGKQIKVEFVFKKALA